MLSVSSGDNLLILGGSNRGYLSSVETVGLERDNNCTTQNLPFRVEGHASVYVPFLRGIVTCGGMDERQMHKKCIIQSKYENNTYFPDMNSNRSHLSMTLVGEKLFAIGGSPSWDSLEIFDVTSKNGRWENQVMPISVSSHCLVKNGETLILTGGYNETDVYDNQCII